jgi:Glycosyl hydrolase family 57
LKNYIVFHLNLAYSSIEEAQRPLVIAKCYWPILTLAEKYHIPVGIEISGYSLECIAALDPLWIGKLRQLLLERKCELIGCGYSQIIGPLVPSQVNDWNQKIGIDVYRTVLETRPQIALINEMAYSSGIVEHYLNNGYKAIVMEWNNPRKYHPEWRNEWRYFPQLAKGTGGRKMPVIWADSIAFQKFQRVVHGDISGGEYIEYLNSHATKRSRFFPLYANDVEIFDFRPGRFKTEAKLDQTRREWESIYSLFTRLKEDNAFEFVLPSKVITGLKNRNGGKLISLESSEQPIPVKKQEKYNINRWAVTGRNNLGINTKCFQCSETMLRDRLSSYSQWKELCYLWSSDFRTHITKKRWSQFQNRLNLFLKKHVRSTRLSNPAVEKPEAVLKIPFLSKKTNISVSGRFLRLENDSFYMELNKNKGLAINQLAIKKISSKPIIGTLEHGFFDDISLGADFYSGHAIIEQPGKHKISDLNLSSLSVCKNGKRIVIKSAGKVDSVEFECCILVDESTICVKKTITFKNNVPRIVRPFNFTFIPGVWNKAKLVYSTSNGGSESELFYLKNKECNQGNLYSPLISSKYGLGATNGMLDIGDGSNSVRFSFDNSQCALIPKITYKEAEENKYFLRIEFSAQEIDETFKPSHAIRQIESSIRIASASPSAKT